MPETGSNDLEHRWQIMEPLLSLAGIRMLSVGISVLMSQLSKGALEAEIANAVTRFHRQQQGKGPGDVRAFIVGDMILVRCQSIFTPVEAHLSASDEGRKLIKSARQELRSINHLEIEEVIAALADCAVLRSHCDLNVEAAEQVEVYILAGNLEKRCAGKL